MRRLALTMVIALLPATAVTDDGAPVRLATDVEGGMRVLRVIGQAPDAWSGRYELEVITGGSNRSLQRGTVTLAPGKPTTIATTRVAPANGMWSARLKVQPAQGAPYEIRLPAGE